MKKLSVEEKAQRYDEALEKARQIHDADRVSGIELTTCEEIFPELTESEDERIRSAMLRGFNSMYANQAVPTFAGEPIRDIIAWLEKQGEITKEWSEMKMNNIQTELQEMVDLKHGEQKHAWSEEDEKLVKNLISTLSNLYARNLIEKETKEKYTNLLKSLKDRVLPQPKQEWSDVDKDILFRTIDSLKFLKDTISTDPNYAVNIIDIEREITWLKSLRPENRWKPTEELLDVFIKNAVDFFESNFNPLTDGGVIGAFDDKKKMIEEFKEYMKEEGFNEEWI